MLTFIQFGSIVFIYYPVAFVCILLGGSWAWGGILFVIVSQILVDNLTPHEKRVHKINNPFLLNLLLYLHLPLGMVILYLLAWQAAPGDLYNTGAVLARLLGSWVMDYHTNLSLSGLVACAFLSGLLLSSNTIAGHELSHRLANRWELLLSQWMLAMNFDAQFTISHVHGHHATVGTPDDSATAYRGETAYRFILRSTIGQYGESYEIEKKRLMKTGQGFYTLHNRLITGLAMSFIIMLLFYLLAGWKGVGMFLISAIYAKVMFELVNYVQHYGLIRKPGTRVEPRHSWDCMSRASTNTFYALSRHSHHHAKAILPYWDLQPAEKMQQQVLYLKYGYLAAVLLAIIPQVWFAHTSPQLLEWDANMASEDEAILAREANVRSGLRSLMPTA